MAFLTFIVKINACSVELKHATDVYIIIKMILVLQMYCNQNLYDVKRMMYVMRTNWFNLKGCMVTTSISQLKIVA